MENEVKKTVSHAGIYAFGNIIQRIVSFIMLPIYTRYLTPADYGTIELLSMILDVTSIITGLGIGQAVFRFYSFYERENEKKEIISTSLMLVIMVNILGFLTILSFSSPLSHFVFGSDNYIRYIQLFSITLVFQAANTIPFIFIRIQQRPWMFVSLSVCKLFLQLSLNIYFVVLLNMKVEGVIYSALISSGFMALVLTCYTLPKTGPRFSLQKALRMVNFSYPMILTGIGTFYLTFGDRYFLRVFDNLTTVGIYSLGYKFGFLLIMLTWQPFSSTWDANKYEHYKSKNIEMFQRIFLYISLITFFVAFCISVFIKDLLIIMADPSFLSAYKIVPIILLVFFFQGWTAFVDLGIYVKGNTNQFVYATIISIAVITLGYVYLIPIWGVYGAAIATILAYVARFLWIYFQARRTFNMHLPWSKVYAIGVIYAVLYGLSTLSPGNIFYSILYHCLIVIIFVVAIVSLPILDRELKLYMLDQAKAFIQRYPFLTIKKQA